MQVNSDSTTRPRTNKQRLPILARHAVSLALVFAVALPLSYFVGQRIHGVLTLDNLFDEDQARFEQGLAYVYKHAADRPWVAEYAEENVLALPRDRGGRLLLALSLSDAESDTPSGIPIDLFERLAEKMPADQAIGLYDKLAAVPGADLDPLNRALLASIPLPRDPSALATVKLLEERLLWSEQLVPVDKWLNWLSVLSKSDSEITQHKAARLLGDLPDEADNPLVVQGLERLAQSRHDSVRAQALTAAAGYARIAKDPVGYEQIIFHLGQDKNKTIARRAWLVVGHLNPFSGFAVNWKEADAFVAEAMLWAAVKTNPENPKPAMDALGSTGHAAAAMLALSQSRTYDYSDLLVHKDIELPTRLMMESPGQAKAVWRSILALHPHLPDPEAWYVNMYDYTKSYNALNAKFGDESVEIDERYRVSFYLASCYRRNETSATETDFSLTESEQAAAKLAAVEGRVIEPFGDQHPLPNALPPIASLIAGLHPESPQDYADLAGRVDLATPWVADLAALGMSIHDSEVSDRWLHSGMGPLKVTAAISHALSGGDPTLITGVTAQLLRDNPEIDREELRAMSDAQLAGLGLKRVDALRALLEAAEAAPPSAGRQSEAKLLRLALWMRGDLGEDFTPQAEAMLFDDELPTSTVLMALLHKQRPIALEYLFGDLVQPRPDLGELFIQQRYWHVFRRFVDTSDLTLWLWGDPEAQAFQLEAMRQWYAVNRWKIERGWWPEVMDDG